MVLLPVERRSALSESLWENFARVILQTMPKERAALVSKFATWRPRRLIQLRCSARTASRSRRCRWWPSSARRSSRWALRRRGWQEAWRGGFLGGRSAVRSLGVISAGLEKLKISVRWQAIFVVVRLRSGKFCRMIPRKVMVVDEGVGQEAGKGVSPGRRRRGAFFGVDGRWSLGHMRWLRGTVRDGKVKRFVLKEPGFLNSRPMMGLQWS